MGVRKWGGGRRRTERQKREITVQTAEVLKERSELGLRKVFEELITKKLPDLAKGLHQQIQQVSKHTV